MAKSSNPSLGLSVQLFGLAAGPAAWIVQLVVDYGLSAYACYPGTTPRLDAPWAGEHGVLLGINLACLAVALAGLGLSFRGWRAAETGAGRDRFLAVCGMLASAAFTIAILFDTPSAVAVRLCWSAPQ